jgi:Xaa-Pro aminopeptidase
MYEYQEKQNLLRAFMQMHQIDALLLRRVSSFAWATLGASSYVNSATSFGEAALLITQDHNWLITNVVEAPRLENEELIKARNWEFEVLPWHQSSQHITELTQGLRLGADSSFPGALDLTEDISRLRATLSGLEIERMRNLCRLCADSMKSAMVQVRPGQSEYEIAALLSSETLQRGVQPILALVGTDERIFHYRHPLPTFKKLDNYAMLVLCGRQYGLVASLTRLIHFGVLPQSLKTKAEALAKVDATFISETRPGVTMGEVFKKAVNAYKEAGYPDEWKLHHQGGLCGFEPREVTATSKTPDVVVAGQVYAWNPSITGTKSEDTILVNKESFDILTETSDWPTIPISMNGKMIRRPNILEVN